MILDVVGPTFCHNDDERAFFRWLQSITGVMSVSGRGQHLLIDVADPLSIDASASLKALKERYQLRSGTLIEKIGRR